MTQLITKAAVKKTGIISRLNHTGDDEFVTKYMKELEGILSKVEQMQQCDVEDVDVKARATKVRISDLRPDEPSEDVELKQRVRQNIIANFPNSQGDLLILPAIFDN